MHPTGRCSHTIVQTSGPKRVPIKVLQEPSMYYIATWTPLDKQAGRGLDLDMRVEERGHGIHGSGSNIQLISLGARDQI